MGDRGYLAPAGARAALAVGIALVALVAARAAAASPPLALGVAVADPVGGDLATYVQAVGRKPALVEWYESFGEPLFYPRQLPIPGDAGAVPMITWGPARGTAGVPLAAIAAGADDSYLRTAAAAAAAWKRPMFIRFAHEMNLPGSPWGPGVAGNTPAGFVAAWRHVVSIFRSAGAKNVRWVWSPNVDCAGACPFDAFYPGDAWVDWVALDGYNYGPVDDIAWMSVDEIFGHSYDDLARLTTKPVMIAETASTEDGGDKAAWIVQGLLDQVPTRLPRVRAVVWFQRDKETDWRINSSAPSSAAFRRVATSSTYALTAAALARYGKPAGLPGIHSWPAYVPQWFWAWARWRLHGAPPSARPRSAPAVVPLWAWARLKAL